MKLKPVFFIYSIADVLRYIFIAIFCRKFFGIADALQCFMICPHLIFFVLLFFVGLNFEKYKVTIPIYFIGKVLSIFCFLFTLINFEFLDLLKGKEVLFVFFLCVFVGDILSIIFVSLSRKNSSPKSQIDNPKSQIDNPKSQIDNGQDPEVVEINQ